MSVQWIKDVDTGELFPVKDDCEYEIPEHLQMSECNHIDYEKTTKTTIDELQSQLTAAQNEIEVIHQEREVPLSSDSEIVSTKLFYFNLSKIIIVIVVAAISIVTVVFACKFAYDNHFVIDTDISVNSSSSDYEVSPIYTPGSIPIYTGDDGAALYINPNSSKSVENQESEYEHQDTDQGEIIINDLINSSFSMLPIFISISVIFIVLKMVIKLIHLHY